MRLLLYFTTLLFFLSCSNNDVGADRSGIALASDKCDSNLDEMVWLDNLIKKAENDLAQNGNIYAVTVNSRVIIVHQPAVMSCMACVLYDCEGNRINVTPVEHESVVNQMTEENLIYNAFD